MNKIKIMHIMQSLEIGGLENGVVNLVNNMNKELFELSICCIHEEGAFKKRIKNNVKIICLHEGEGFKWLLPFKLAKLFKEEKPDIVHTHGWGQGSLYGIIGARLAMVPVVINGEHGSFFLKPQQIYVQRILSSLCNTTLSVSESLKKEIVKKLCINAFKIIPIPNGVDTTIFTGNYNSSGLKRKISKESGIIIEENNFIVGNIGSLKPQKNQIFLLKALKKINEDKQISNIKVLFIGNGPYKKRLEQYVVNNALNNQVIFLGERNDISKLLSIIDVLVLTSIPRCEGLSNVILEAMSSEVPVISTKSIGSIELIMDGLNGFLVEHEDVQNLVNKLKLLVYNPILLKKMGYNARQFVCEKYSIEKMISSYEKTYLDSL